MNIMAGDNLTPEYLAKNPHGLLPLLELDDGTLLGESVAICRYFEELHPEPPLMGSGAMDKAVIEMWSRRADFEGMLAVVDNFRNKTPELTDRGLPGRSDVPLIPQLIERGQASVDRFFHHLERQLSENEFLAGDRFTIADIGAMCATDFADFSGLDIPADCPSVRRWYDRVNGRPSAQAWPGMKSLVAKG